MSGEAYFIDIDSIVLTGVDLRNPGRLRTLIEAEVQKALSGSDLRVSTGVASNEARVAGEVAGSVVQALRGGTDNG